MKSNFRISTNISHLSAPNPTKAQDNRTL